MIGAPPSEGGAAHDSVTRLLPDTPRTPVGAGGGPTMGSGGAGEVWTGGVPAGAVGRGPGEPSGGGASDPPVIVAVVVVVDDGEVVGRVTGAGGDGGLGAGTVGTTAGGWVADAW